MKIINALEAPEAPNPHGVSARALHNSEHVQVLMVTLQPGEALKRHRLQAMTDEWQAAYAAGVYTEFMDREESDCNLPRLVLLEAGGRQCKKLQPILLHV